MKIEEIEVLKTKCSSCNKCHLCETRNNVVFGTGNIDTKIMFVGEGPGEQEDLQGEPFVGPAGKLLDIMLELIGLDRNKVYIANIVKCRPPMNRDPNQEEKEACLSYVLQQIDLIDPKLIICLGRIAATSLIDPEFKITKEHGIWFDIGMRKVLATYHPSALLRDENKRPEAFEDFVKIREELKKYI